MNASSPAAAWYPNFPNAFARFNSVDLVREVYARYAQRDYAGLFELLSSDIEISQTTELPWGGHFRGLEGAREFFSRLIRHRDATPELLTYIPAGPEVAVSGKLRGKIRATGKSIDVDLVHVWTIGDGRITRWRAFENTPVLLTALGLG